MTHDFRLEDVQPGDTLRYKSSGVSATVHVYGIRQLHPEGIEVYTDYYRRNDGSVGPIFLQCIRTESITHRNRRKIRRST